MMLFSVAAVKVTSARVPFGLLNSTPAEQALCPLLLHQQLMSLEASRRNRGVSIFPSTLF